MFLFEDECSMSNTAIVSYKWSTKGKQPIIAQKQSRRERHGKIHMILDNVRYHHAKALQHFLKKNEDRIDLFFLPAYSPDLNPIERVWWYMRKCITNNRYIHSLKERMISFWKLFSHFQKPNDFIINLCNLNYSV